MTKPATAAPEITVRQLPATIEYLNPDQISVRNIRHAKPDQRLIDSVRENGVLQPIGVLRTPEGELVLRFGDRRRQACAELGRQVPAIVIDGTAGTDRDQIERLFEQLDENDNRQDLTAADRATAVATLFDLGASQRMITHKTGLGQAEIAAARKVAASQTAAQVAAQYPLTLEQLAAVTEFEDDGEAVKTLTAAAEEGTGRFAHALQQERNAKAGREAVAAHAAKLAKRGITVISHNERPSFENALYNWADENGNRLDDKTAKKKHEKCPGNVVFLQAGYGREVSESWYCTDPKGNGHKRYRLSGGTDQTPEQRQEVIAGNKAWRSAEKVRRDWLREFLARPKVPDGGLLFTLEAFARSGRPLRYAMDHRENGCHITARDLLGIPRVKGSWYDPPEVHTAMTKASPARAQVIALAMVLGAYEGSISIQSWRTPDAETAEYLEALAGWGYELSDIERELVTAVRQGEADHAAVVKQDEADAAAHGSGAGDDPAKAPDEG